MAEFNPTPAQKAAIESRGSTVLVSAGAGSGKTKVLTERLMSYITDAKQPCDLDSFLIITFTRAAAGELKGRIMDEIAEALAKEPGNRRLRRQSVLCQRAQIGTIHSFCANVLRENSHLTHLPPDFKIIDDDRADAMKAAALERVMEQCYREPEKHPGFLFLADTVGAGQNDRRLSELVLSLHAKMQCHARPALWAEKQVKMLNSGEKDVAATPWGREILSAASETVKYWCGEFDRLLAEIQAVPKIFECYSESLTATGDELRELLRCLQKGWDAARACLPVSFPRLGTLRNSPDPELSDRVKSRRGQCKKAMEKLGTMLYADSASLLSGMRLTAPAMEALLQLTMDFDAAFSSDKQRSALADYSDLEHLTAQLLTNPDGSPTELAALLSQRYTEIMVDEYQDVSRVQDTIFRAISKNGSNLFLVGDVKQSIYRFRLADPEIFTEKYLSYADADKALPGEARRILLSENFRSRQEILECANCVFSLCMSRTLGDIDYDDAAALKYGAAYYEGSVPVPELLLIPVGKGPDDEETPDKTALEAQAVARRIKEIVESGTPVTDHGVQRPARYGDIAILLRSANAVGGAYRLALASAGIPAASVQSGGFFSSVEVSVVMSMLAIIDNPHQDIPLIAVLRSPCFSFSGDELSAVRALDRDADFYTALCLAGEKDEKCAAFLRTLNELRDCAPDLPVSELMWEIVEKLDMLAICSAMNDGPHRRANLMELSELSEQYESTGYRGLHRFVLWLRHLAERGQEPAGAVPASAVQIMSIHKSKGLEFPIVFICDTARRFNRQDSGATVLVHPVLGLGPKVTDLKRRVEYPTLARSAIKLRLEREMLSEEMRLLYVAMTRPKERLFITAGLKDPDKTLEKLSSSVSDRMAPEILSGASSPLDWLIWASLADGGRHLKLSICESDADGLCEAEEDVTREADPALSEELQRRLSFVYPYAEAESLPSKITATELKGRAEADADAVSAAPKRHRPFRLPDFARAEKPLTGTERGTATHLVLQYMDFSKSGSLEEIQGEIERMREKRFLSDREAQAVDAEAILRLFKSGLGKRMLRAEKMRREFKFSLLCDAESVFKKGRGEEVLLQGVVDCCIEENGEITVIDYKTDSLRSKAALSERAALYAPQLSAYAAALRRIFGKPVRECILYFLSAGEAVSLPQDGNT